MLGYGWKLYDGHYLQMAEWNEEAKTAFEQALWMEVDKRAIIPMFHYSSGSNGMDVLKEHIPDSVTIESENGHRIYKIDRYKYDHSLIKETNKRAFLGALLAKYPLPIDTLSMHWDSLLSVRQIPVRSKIRYIYTDWALQDDTTYSVTDARLHWDSLTVKYLGFRCEHELVAYASHPHWLSQLSKTDWGCLLLPWGLSVVLLVFYVPLERAFRRKFIEEKIVEREIHVADVSIDKAKIYQLPDGVLFDSFKGTLTKGNLVHTLPPQSALLFRLFLRKGNHRLSVGEIEQELWNGEDSTGKIYKVIQRLRDELKKVSPNLVIKNVNGEYELK